MKLKALISILLASLMLFCGCGVMPAAPDPTAAPDNTAAPEDTQQATHHGHEGYLIAQPVSHDYAPDPNTLVSESGEADWDKYDELMEDWQKQLDARREAAKAAPDMRAFTEALFNELMKNGAGENLVFSPANVYMALAMLAETTGGDTRAEILSALDVKDMDELRANASALMKAEPVDDGISKCGIANSLWLNDGFGFNTEALERVAEVYEGSSYWGDPADAGFTQALRDWLNANTGNMLEKSVAGVELPPELIVAIASAIYFKAAWMNDYAKGLTDKMTFHAPGGDMEADFMHKDVTGHYFKGEGFSAYCETLKNGAGNMWFLLPDEGVSVTEMMNGPGMDFIFGGKEGLEHAEAKVHVSMPKLDVESETLLDGALKGMGVTSCFGGGADFSPLISGTDVCVSSVLHAARVKTDEEGVEAAAFTLIYCGAGMPLPPEEEIDFVLDRPFVFVITGQSDAPLFMGTVNSL